MNRNDEYDKSMSLYLRYLKQRGISLQQAIQATRPSILPTAAQHRNALKTNARTGQMRFNPKAKLKASQVRDLRGEQRSTRYGYGSPDGQ